MAVHVSTKLVWLRNLSGQFNDSTSTHIKEHIQYIEMLSTIVHWLLRVKPIVS